MEIVKGVVGAAIVICTTIAAIYMDEPNLLWFYLIALFLF